MDTLEFDRFTKTLATVGPRRRVLQVLAALPLGGAL
jgi:hypothetical protein